MMARQLINRLTSDAILDFAYHWLCKQRRHWPDAADVWSFRRDWSEEKLRLQADLRAGRYGFGLQERVTRASGEVIESMTSHTGSVACRAWP